MRKCAFVVVIVVVGKGKGERGKREKVRREKRDARRECATTLTPRCACVSKGIHTLV